MSPDFKVVNENVSKIQNSDQSNGAPSDNNIVSPLFLSNDSSSVINHPTTVSHSDHYYHQNRLTEDELPCPACYCDSDFCSVSACYHIRGLHPPTISQNESTILARAFNWTRLPPTRTSTPALTSCEKSTEQPDRVEVVPYTQLPKSPLYVPTPVPKSDVPNQQHPLLSHLDDASKESSGGFKATCVSLLLFLCFSFHRYALDNNWIYLLLFFAA